MGSSLVIVAMALTLTIDAQKTTSQGDYKLQGGGYNKKDNCYYKGYPKKYTLPVGYGHQSPKIRRTIYYALKEYPAVKESLKNSYIKCDKAYYYYQVGIGQEETCPTDLKLVTKVSIENEWCDVAKPNFQCVTATSCETPKHPCAGDQGSHVSSSCMYAGFRYFHVWVYCKSCGFKLIKLKLPQCCSCRKFQVCNDDDDDDNSDD